MVWRPRTEIGRRIKHFIRTGETTPPPRGTRRVGFYKQISGEYDDVLSIIVDDESTVVITSTDKKVWDYPMDVVFQCDCSSLPITVSHSGVETIIEVPPSQRMTIKEQFNKLKVIGVYQV